MLRSLIGLVVLGAFLTSAVPVSAHDEYRIIGTVTKISSTEISVKQKDGKIVAMDINKQTKVTRDKKPAPFAEIKVGGSVVVDAIGDSILDLLVLEVRLVPAITSAK